MKADTLLRMRQDSVEEYMLSQMAAEGLYQEALNMSASLGLYSCTLKVKPHFYLPVFNFDSVYCLFVNCSKFKEELN